jgi:outer membrane protein TolC
MTTNQSHWILSAMLMMCSFSAMAQKEYRLSVKEATNLAAENVAEIKNLRLDSLKQWAQNREIIGSAFPQVTGSVQAAHYLTLPKVLFPSAGETDIYNVLSREGVKNASGTPIQPKQEFTLQEFSFVQPWTIQAGVSMNQLLFQPEVFVGLLARKTLMEFAANNISVAIDKTREQVQKAYYQVLIAQQQADVLKKTIQRIEKLQSDQEQMFKNGFIEKLDIDKSTVSLNNLKSTQTQLNNVIELGYAALKFSLGLNQQDKLVLTDDLNETTVKENVLDEGAENYQNRSEYRLLATSQKLSRIDVKRYQLGYIPTLSFFYQFQQQGQLNKDFSQFTGQNWFWFNSNLIGLNLSVPIFDGFQRKYKIKQARYTLEKVNNSIEQFKHAVDLEQNVAKITLRNALINMDNQKKNLELAERVYNTTKKKYENGLGSSFEVLTADTELQRAQGNYFDALYQAAIAKISYLKATGKLN